MKPDNSTGDSPISTIPLSPAAAVSTIKIMKAIGRLLQILGLVLLPLSMMMQLTDMLGRPFYVSHMVVMMVFGVAAFYLGRLLEGYAGG
jgi:hypothetical protein